MILQRVPQRHIEDYDWLIQNLHECESPQFQARYRNYWAMNIAIGADHRGCTLADRIATDLETSGHTVLRLGELKCESSDYPDSAFAVASAVAKGNAERGVLICGSGIGMSIAANKVRGVRAALCGCHRSHAVSLLLSHHGVQRRP